MRSTFIRFWALPRPTDERKVLFTLLGGFVILLFLLPPEIFGEGGQLELDFAERSCSLRVDQVPLKTILTKIEEEKDIWFKASQSLGEETVSLGFSELSIREGIERILRNFDYSLHFDQDGKLLGVTVLSKRETSDSWGRKAISPSRRESRKGFYPKTLFGLESSSKELPFNSPVVTNH
jgi:hypothetical protein